MAFNPENPIIAQSDRTILLETASPRFVAARDALAGFAELVKSPEHIHTYRLTPLSLWNAAAVGFSEESVLNALEEYSKYPIPENIISEVKDFMSRYGRLKLEKFEDDLWMTSEDRLLLIEVCGLKSIIPLLDGSFISETSPLTGTTVRIKIRNGQRGFIKHALIKVGFPIEDLAGYVEGEHLPLALRSPTLGGHEFGLRDYQHEAVDAFWQGGGLKGGSGTIVLPCGAGKTIVAIGALNAAQTSTLILTTNVTALRQWRDEILDKTNLDPELLGEYSGHTKEIKPITITTYQILTYRKTKNSEFLHFGLFNRRNWGLIIYDEVHLLPAPVFRAVANLQSRRRLGLTATLVREDGKEEDVFSLIGPKKYDVPWRELEGRGWIATAQCIEIRVPFPNDDVRLEYAVAETRDKHRLGSTNPAKTQVVLDLVNDHVGDRILVIGQYLSQLGEISEALGVPIITGKTPQSKRDVLYGEFRSGVSPVLVVSKVANFAVDLPDANVAIQISGTFGSRQEEAQRLGRILRPKKDKNTAIFYSVVTRDSTEQTFSAKRQLFLTEQGYRYRIENVETFKLYPDSDSPDS